MTPIIGDLIESGARLIQSYFPPDMTPEQRAEAEARLAGYRAEQAAKLIQFQADMESELTRRHQADMTSDSWLSKNVRPLVLVYLMAAWTIFAGFSMYSLAVDSAYVDMLKDMLMAAFGFYFVSRGAEKITAIIKGTGQ